MSSKESQVIGVIAKDLHGRRPEPSRLLVWAAFRTLAAALRGDAQMLDHGVVPLDELLRKRARLERSDAIAKNSVHVHVSPILSAGPQRPDSYQHQCGQESGGDVCLSCLNSFGFYEVFVARLRAGT